MLTQAQIDNGWEPAANAENYNPVLFSFIWNEDYSAFRATKLPWWDDASYAAYQGYRFDPEE